MAEDRFEIVQREDDTPSTYDPAKFELTSALEILAGGFGKIITGVIGLVGKAIAGIGLGAIKLGEMIVDTAKAFAGAIADSIRGKKGAMTEIGGAVDEKLGPIDTAITESGKRFTELSERVDGYDKAQTEVLAEVDKAIDKAGNAIATAEKNRTDLAAFNKQVSDKIVSITADADAALDKADAISKKQSEIISNADKQKKVVDQAVLDLSTATNNFNAYKAAQDEKLKKLTAQADKGIADAKTANDAIAKANKELSSRIADGVAAHEDVRTAVADAKKATAALDNLVDIGGSLIPLVPGTTQPAWTKHNSAVDTGEQWEDHPVILLSGFFIPESRWVKVAPETVYKVSLWARADAPDTRIFIELRDQTGSLAVVSSTQDSKDGEFQFSRYPVANFTPSESWAKHEWYIKLSPTATEVKLVRFFVNHQNGSDSAPQYIAKFDITPAVTPPQALDEVRKQIESASKEFSGKVNSAISANKDVQAAKATAEQASSELAAAKDDIDALQTNAILRNTQVGSSNAKAIDVITGALAVQKVVNDNQDKWNKTATNLMKLQGEAIKKNEKVGSTNATAIEVLDKAWEAQDTINKNQEKWNAASTTATSANTQAIQALARRDFRQSLIQYRDLTPEDIENGRREVYYPYWALATDTYRDFSTDKSFIEGPHNQKHMWGYTRRATVAVNSHHAYMQVTPGKHYKLSLWHRAKDPGSRYFIQMITPSGQENKGFRIVYGVDENGDLKLSGPTSYIVADQEMPADRWERIEVIIEIEPDVTELSFRRIFWNHQNGKDANGNVIQTDQWITGLEFGPDIPTQADIDKAQNNAIKALADQQALDQKFQKEQKNWNKASSDATKALSKATKLLAKPNYGDSLIAYEKPSDSTLEDPGRPVDWLKPEWKSAFPRNLIIHPKGGITYAHEMVRYDGEPTSVIGQNTLMPVKPGTTYKLSFYAFGDDTLTISVRSNPNGGIKSAKQVVETKDGYTYVDVNHAKYYAVRDLPLTEREVKYTFLVEFDDAVTEAALFRFYLLNSGKAKTGSQTIGAFVFEPNVPTQAQVDEAQNKAIEALQASDVLDQKFKRDQQKINRTVQAQQWLHQDMLELLDIRTPKAYGWPAGYSYRGEGQTTNPYTGYRAYKIVTPYYEQWEQGAKDVYVAARGQWVGWMQVMINWDSGVVDEWYVQVNPDDRVFRFNGGAAHLKKRFIGVTVYPRSLKRTVSVTWYRGAPGDSSWNSPHSWKSISDPNKLVRKREDGYIRFKNTVTCDEHIIVRTENGLKAGVQAGKPIFSSEIHAEDQIFDDDEILKFTEVDDPSLDEEGNTSYGLDDTRPSGIPKLFDSHTTDN